MKTHPHDPRGDRAPVWGRSHEGRMPDLRLSPEEIDRELGDGARRRWRDFRIHCATMVLTSAWPRRSDAAGHRLVYAVASRRSSLKPALQHRCLPHADRTGKASTDVSMRLERPRRAPDQIAERVSRPATTPCQRLQNAGDRATRTRAVNGPRSNPRPSRQRHACRPGPRREGASRAENLAEDDFRHSRRSRQMAQGARVGGSTSRAHADAA